MAESDEKAKERAEEQSTTAPPMTITVEFTPATDLTGVTAVESFTEDDTRAILHQVEFYFSDQNLSGDRHLLMLSGGDGNGDVSFNEVCRWKKMRRFKPVSAIQQVMRQSAVLDIVKPGKHARIKRKFPLMLKPHVEPEIDGKREHVAKILEANPHLTSNMLKPTGFEEYYTDPPVTPWEHEKNKVRYDPDTVFSIRIENAIRHYRTKRKMHQSTLRVFDLWMNYGGIQTSQAMFTGGLEEDDLDGLDKEDIAARKFTYSLAEHVVDSEEDWEVDFAAIAKSFLSTEFLDMFEWHNTNEVENICNVMRNFYNFLLHHDVCPEYADQIHAARQVLLQAETELPKLAALDKKWARAESFSTACSTLQGAHQSAVSAAQGNWVKAEWDSGLGLEVDDARFIFLAGVTAFATEDQLQRVEEMLDTEDGLKLNTTSQETLGLEVIGVEFCNDEQAAYFERLEGTAMSRMGKLRCRRWKVPDAPRKDPPVDASSRKQHYEFIVEEDMLVACVPGMKFVATVKQLDLGIWYIERVVITYPSFFVWLPNGKIKDWKEPREPKAWMKRLTARRDEKLEDETMGDSGDRVPELGSAVDVVA